MPHQAPPWGSPLRPSDADATTNGITYSLDDDAGGRFAINASSGVVTVASVLDAETATAHSITVRATSADGSSSTQSFTIAVSDVNEFDVSAVTDADATPDSVAEDATVGTLVGITAAAVDADVTLNSGHLQPGSSTPAVSSRSTATAVW